MRKRKADGKKKMAQQMKGILLIMGIILIIYTIISTVILDKNTRQTMRELDEMSELYTDELDNRFLRISRRLFLNVMEKNNVDFALWKYIDIIKEEDVLTTNYAVQELQEYFLSYAWEYGTEYKFFLYLQEQDRYIDLSLSIEGEVKTAEMQAVLEQQIEKLANTSYSVKKKWSGMTYQEENYICQIAQNQDVYLGCYVNVKSILEPFSKISMGEDGYVVLVDDFNQIVGMLTNQGIKEEVPNSQMNGNRLIVKSMKRAPFQIQINVSDERIVGVLLGTFGILFVLAAVLIAAGIGILLYLKRYLLYPVQQFTDRLLAYEENDFEERITEVNLLELEQIDGQFKKMIGQIKKLKISLYEQELEKQKIEMDYLKLQIRPHFYLNCLNYIYSMIDFEQYESASQMAAITSDYLQYIFRNTKELVAIHAEASHCKNYLEILLLRYQNGFKYYIEIHEEIREASILPFLIQVFIENAAKHALSMEKKILISVTALPEDRIDGTYVNIYISDTGKGFPSVVLEQLEQGRGVSSGGKHVGIENCLRRFRFYYGDRGEIHFANSPLGGAIVDIHIPYQRYEENETRGVSYEYITGR